MKIHQQTARRLTKGDW